MANKRFPRKGDKVILVGKAYEAIYGKGTFEVTVAAHVFDRDIVVELKGIGIKIPARDVEIV